MAVAGTENADILMALMSDVSLIYVSLMCKTDDGARKREEEDGTLCTYTVSHAACRMPSGSARPKKGPSGSGSTHVQPARDTPHVPASRMP